MNKKIYIVPVVKVEDCKWLDDLCDLNVGMSGTPVDGEDGLGKEFVDDGVDDSVGDVKPASVWE